MIGGRKLITQGDPFFFGGVLERVMLETYKNVQLCAITCHVVSCDWWMCDGGTCEDTLPPPITRHMASHGTKLHIFMCP